MSLRVTDERKAIVAILLPVWKGLEPRDESTFLTTQRRGSAHPLFGAHWIRLKRLLRSAATRFDLRLGNPDLAPERVRDVVVGRLPDACCA
jgi:hypothetical protein